ncbi:hypothetical protein [Natronorubrum daqingense]|nr:hypothetical protein [Natronorubrum daqingense]
MIGVSKEEYIEHLRENGEELAADIVEKMVVDESDCADAKPPEDGSVCADASGYQPEECPGCLEPVNAYVEVIVGENGTVSKKSCIECGHEWVERYVDTDTQRGET